MKELICIVCPKGCHLKVDEENGCAVTGNGCPRGAEYGKSELLHPTRVLTSTVKVQGGLHRRLPVKTSASIPKGMLFEVMRTLDNVQLTAPVAAGQVVVPNVLGTGADIIATRSMEKQAE